MFATAFALVFLVKLNQKQFSQNTANHIIEKFRLISLNHVNLEQKNKITANSWGKSQTQPVKTDFVITRHVLYLMSGLIRGKHVFFIKM